MLRRGRLAWLTMLFASFGLVAAACGNDTKSGSADGSSTTSTTVASGPAAPSDSSIKALTAKIAGAGSSFTDAFLQAINTDFSGVASQELVTYAKSGSSDGRKQLADKTVDFAGSDSTAKPGEFTVPILYFPTVAAPITVSYNLTGVDKLQLSADTIAKIFSAQITTWDDAAIKADNPGATLPSAPITVVHRSDGSGTTNNFTKYLASAAPSSWTLGSADTVNWPATTQGAEKNSGVTGLITQTQGAIGYVDLADAVKSKLTFADIKNDAGNYVAPSVKGVQAALANAVINPDLTYNPLNAKGADAYPISSPTWIIVYQAQSDPAKAATLKAYLQYILTAGQKQAQPTGYVGLPAKLQQQAIDQIAKITG